MSKVFRWGNDTKGGFEGQLDGDDMDTNGGADTERTVRSKPVRKAMRSVATPRGKQQKK